VYADYPSRFTQTAQVSIIEPKPAGPSIRVYDSSLEHLLAEFKRLDLLIIAQLTRMREQALTKEGLQGLYISDQEIDALIAQPLCPYHGAGEIDAYPAAALQATLAPMVAEIAAQCAESERRGVELRLEKLLRLFHLSAFDKDVLLICLAPELDLRYERFYAYLQDDISKKSPSVDLALNLLCSSFATKVAARRCFLPDAPLIKNQLLALIEEPGQQVPLLAKAFKLDARIADYLLGGNGLDARLLAYTRLIISQARLEDSHLSAKTKAQLVVVAQRRRRDGLVCYFHGSCGMGKQLTAEALCAELKITLLQVDLGRLLTLEQSYTSVLPRIFREALLQDAALYWTGFDALFAADKAYELEALLRYLQAHRGMSILAGEPIWQPGAALGVGQFVAVAFDPPGHDEGSRLWARALPDRASLAADVDLGRLANSFRLNPGQIRDAAAAAQHLAVTRDSSHPIITQSDLQHACRLQSSRTLATLAEKITPRYRWDDMVLPLDRLEQLREICNTLKYRSLVYGDWGFDRKLAMGKGINALFAGSSGTGKTMAAEVIAAELGLDLYRIDLSALVSKYIGETEKNLARLFAEAESSNAILFFDEADALFGKRTEVKDAHDRYANVETSYLLQRMEAYTGMVILASNFRKNMDDAFVRRLHFTVEFPFPSVHNRRCIWVRIWPEAVPRSLDLDMDALARIELTGGNIRNVALAAAFLAAADQGVVTMAHCKQALKREYQKMGKVMTGVDWEY
jgi:SpoVK/Ycf46/Vps4 family AAA+-type ATPase